MASPQLKNGFIRIAKEIAQALMRTNLSAYQSRFLWVLWTQTYGWNKKEDWISNSQLVGMTGLAKGHISRTKKELEMRNIIVTNSGNKIAFNQDHTQWRELPDGVRGYQKVTPSGKLLPHRVPKVTPSGGHKRKESLQKNIYVETSNEFRLSKLLLDLITERKPDYKKPDLQKWAVHIGCMIRLDKRNPKIIEEVIRWCQADVDFWQDNILSTEKLRKQFDQLELKMAKSTKDDPKESDAFKRLKAARERKGKPDAF